MTTIEREKHELWLLTGSQHLYGDDTLASVARNSQQIADAVDRSGVVPIK
jgi:L-arabinose isomerase